jgi:hypothetical protein
MITLDQLCTLGKFSNINFFLIIRSIGIFFAFCAYYIVFIYLCTILTIRCLFNFPRMEKNNRSLVENTCDIEKTLLENPTFVFFGTDLQTKTQFKSFPCQIVSISNPIVRVKHNIKHKTLFISCNSHFKI